MLRRRPVVRIIGSREDLLRQPENTEAEPQSKLLETAALVVMALAAVFSAIAQSKENPALALTLAGVAVLAISVNAYKPVLAFVRRYSQQRRRKRAARRYWPELLRFEQRFADFVNRNNITTFQYALRDFCQQSQIEFTKLFPPDFLPDFFRLFVERQEAKPPKSEPDFSGSVKEFKQMVWSYNQEYVLTPLERLRRDSELRSKLPDHYRSHFERQIEDCRDRWVRFLDDFNEFLADLENQFGYGTFGTYFERPQKL